MKTFKILLVIGLSALVMAPTASAATSKERSQAKTIKSLKKQLKTAKKKLVAANGVVATLSGQVNTLSGTVNALKGQAGTLSGQMASLSAENMGLRGSLSEGVAAIARSDSMATLRDVVLKPAHDNWVCGGYFDFGTYGMTYTFDGRYQYDGSCT